tara:strand:- start:1122 stop:1241 length:120 start_codon:yes stop_codon:yes gene_type:complete
MPYRLVSSQKLSIRIDAKFTFFDSDHRIRIDPIALSVEK